jgi:hypothetical protein
VNLVGGQWYGYNDRAFGGGNTISAFSFPSGAPAGTPGKGLLFQSNDQRIYTFIPDQPSGYYGFVGVYTTFTAATNLGSLTGIRFYVQKGAMVTGAQDSISVWLGSKYKDDNNINSHYRASVTVTATNTWQQVSIPWSSFTLGYVYDSGYPNHQQSLSEVLKDVVKIGVDKSFHYTSTSVSPMSWTQYPWIDDVEIYK